MRATTRHAALLLAGFFLAWGLGPSATLAASSGVDAEQPSTPVMLAAGGQGEQAPPACGSGNLACSMDSEAPPAPCVVPAGCAAAALLPGGHPATPTDLPVTRDRTRPAETSPATIFPERLTPPPRV